MDEAAMPSTACCAYCKYKEVPQDLSILPTPQLLSSTTEILGYLDDTTHVLQLKIDRFRILQQANLTLETCMARKPWLLDPALHRITEMYRMLKERYEGLWTEMRVDFGEQEYKCKTLMIVATAWVQEVECRSVAGYAEEQQLIGEWRVEWKESREKRKEKGRADEKDMEEMEKSVQDGVQSQLKLMDDLHDEARAMIMAKAAGQVSWLRMDFEF